MEQVDSIVIGAGVVGLATARALAMGGHEVVILEAEAAIGTHTSSRNTGCIHAGLSYIPGSLKARLALRGKELLYQFCANHGVGHSRCGKMLVALDEAGGPKLAALKDNAAKIGCGDLEYLPADQVREMEPALRFHTVLYSPSSGIVDAHELMHEILGEAETHGAALALNAPVEGGAVTGDGIELAVGGDEHSRIRCRSLVNAAGFGAQKVAAALEGVPPTTVPGQFLTKGNYFVLQGKSPFSHLIYPLPDEFTHAVHVSLDMGGQLRFGPDTEEIDGTIDYTVDPNRAPFFYDAARRYWPELPDGALIPGYAGIRPKIAKGRASLNDFVVQTEETHGINGLINLYGIESPGLTSSLAIGEHVAALIGSG